MGIESRVRVRALSPKGAMGLMQIMPKTSAELSTRYHLGSDPYDPRNNILAGAAYLREMHDRYGPPVSSPLTTPGRLATTNIWRRVGRCRSRRRTASRCSCR
jgi:soluble lytic murein transglycosylase-like protein